jgi:hypothetical protein
MTERQRYRELKLLLDQVARTHRDNLQNTFRDPTIVAVMLWACLNNRPIVWAVDATHWPRHTKPRAGLPSQSCMSRRMRSRRVLELIERFDQAMRDTLPSSDIKLIDGRPLPVGGCSKDPDAKTGYGAGHLMRGYKLHLITDKHGPVDHWIVTPMNGSEPDAALAMLPHVRDAAYVIGDGNYDTNQLYDEAADQGIQWLTQPRRSGSKAPGHRKQSTPRLSSWHWTRSDAGLRTIKQVRSGIERVNAWQGCADVGLVGLPHHVRRTHRVQLWVALKIIIYHHWLAPRLERRMQECA